MEKKYVTIKEFATAKGVSTQAVYQRLEKDLKPYLKIINNKKMLSIEALSDTFSIVQNNMQISSSLQQVKTQEDRLIDTLQETVKVLSEQLKEKDLQISELNKRLSEAHQRIAESNELNRNNQVIISKSQEIKMLTVRNLQQAQSKKKSNFWDKLFSKHN